ncbi:hypothetical protein jhhlp_007553 [Lomentospora prolificans]|uniref:Uncharacterized protein n=1 Tax=Lomentospora prolificans TaxID=41688 RepID=A0A2N3MZV6_9PEZI|nr:hypothetical protein jhhlp_007553 [Lomentospora prolificans]
MTPSTTTTLAAQRVWKHLKKLRQQQYGPTEKSVTVALRQCAYKILLSYEDAGNMGRACRTVTWVVDQNDHSRLLPIGAFGELCVQGPGLADG